MPGVADFALAAWGFVEETLVGPADRGGAGAAVATLLLVLGAEEDPAQGAAVVAGRGGNNVFVPLAWPATADEEAAAV